jgi:hypothetical protein
MLTVEATMDFSRTEDADLYDKYHPVSLLLVSADLKEIGDSLDIGQKYKITFERVE